MQKEGKFAGTTGHLVETAIPLSPHVMELSRRLLLPLLDILCILVVPFCQSRASSVLQNPSQYLGFWTLLALATVLLINSYGGYRSWEQNRGQTAKLAVRCFIATAITTLTVALLFGHQHAVSHYWTTAELVLPPLLLVFTRSVTAASLVTAPPSEGPLVVCLDRCPRDLAKALTDEKITARPSGVLFLAEAGAAPVNSPWPVVPDIRALLRIVQGRRVRDIVFVYDPALEELSWKLQKALLSDLLAFPVRIWLAFSVPPELPVPLLAGYGRCRLVPVANDGLLNSLNLGKRLFDIAVGLLLLTLAMPLLGAIAALVRFSGTGPIVFRQQRIGAHDRAFTVLKFRTMIHGNGAAFAQAGPGDARVTWTGRFLRRTSLDELLQLVNVVRGDMSLVGPRPHAPETQVEGIDFEQAVQFYRLRHRVKPGMTGLAQVRGHRGETRQVATLENRIASDLEYIAKWSIWLDISIILRTLPTLITQRNAH